MIRIKRTYEPAARTYGRRILVERLWPRGMKKESLALDAWLKDVAPSTGLRKWFGHEVNRWEEFRRRYRAELDANPGAWEPVLDVSRAGAVTLLYSAHDTLHNGAVVLGEYLKEKRTRRAGRRSNGRRASAPIARRRSTGKDARAALPAQIPRLAKRRAGRSAGDGRSADVRTTGVPISPRDRVYIRRRLGMKLRKFSSSIERVTVRVEDVNGPRGGVDKVCKAKVVLAGLPSVVVERKEHDIRAAVDGALDATERAVRRVLDRRRSRPRRVAAGAPTSNHHKRRQRSGPTRA